MLTADILVRLNAITDVFYEIDGITFDNAVALNQADSNPGKSILIYEEMSRIYRDVCNSRSMEYPEKEEVYKILLLRSLYEEHETINRIDTHILPQEEAIRIIRQYRLKAESPLPCYH